MVFATFFCLCVCVIFTFLKLSGHTNHYYVLSIDKDNDDLYRNEKITSDKFWSNIHEGIKAKNYTYTVDQCLTKMESFKRTYKNTIEKRGKSGTALGKDMPYYDESNYYIKKIKSIRNTFFIILVIT